MRGNLVLVVTYRPPNTDVKIFIQKLNNILDQIKRERKLCYIMGDYNINILNYESNSATAEFVDTMYAFTFLPLINQWCIRPFSCISYKLWMCSTSA